MKNFNYKTQRNRAINEFAPQIRNEEKPKTNLTLTKRDIETIDKLKFLKNHTRYMRDEQFEFFTRFYTSLLHIITKGFTLTLKQESVVNNLYEEIIRKIQIKDALQRIGS